MEHLSRSYRRILHIDLDAFYVSAELLRHPELRRLPLVVGGSPEGRGVVCASSYEARAFGVRSGTPCRKAKELCPQLQFLVPDFPYYAQLSARMLQILARYTERIEAYSYDEAYLDISNSCHPSRPDTSGESSTSAGTVPTAKDLAGQICNAIRGETGLSASVGVSYNKFLAKLASDFRKPGGLTVVSPSRAKEFIARHKARDLYGIGRVRAKALEESGFHSAGELQQLSPDQLGELLQSHSYAQFLYHALRGHDERPVAHISQHRAQPKSLGAERTFAVDIPLQSEQPLRGQAPCWQERLLRAEQLFAELPVPPRQNLASLRQLPPESPHYRDLSLWLYELCHIVSNMLQQQQLAAESLCLKMRCADFQTYSRTVSWQGPENRCRALFPKAALAFQYLSGQLYQNSAATKLRLLGLSSRSFRSANEVSRQGWLF